MTPPKGTAAKGRKEGGARGRTTTTKSRAKATGARAAAPRKKPAARKPAAAKPKAKPVDAAAPSRPKSALRRIAWWAIKAAGIGISAFLFLSSAGIMLYRYVNPPLTPLMLLRNFEGQGDLHKAWRSLDEISPEFLLSVVAAEDQLFFTHRGFDVKQIQAAIESHLEGGSLRGGSTISQQVAKNVFLWPSRSWIRKGLEVWFTLGIEYCWSKDRILEVYVNVAEMGDGVYGVEAAAQHYYHKPARDLTREEGALLAAILPAPRDRSPVHPTPYLLQRQHWILGQMRNLGGTGYLELDRSN